jgi:sigma-E factor negative regulatory protein RseB
MSHLLYGDGVASVSVYVEALSRGVPVFTGAASRGALSLHGRVVGGHQITVLGDVPAATVERFAQGISLTGDG